jgi:acyl-CoA synthetase (AMP-forming)/AMP-acid ligase II
MPLTPGPLVEPLSGRRWDRDAVLREVAGRSSHYAARGVAPGDRVFLLYGNRLEFFADLLALWSLGACAVPVDARLTPFEVGTLAAAARPRLALFHESLDGGAAAALADAGAALLDAADVPPTVAGGPSAGGPPVPSGDASDALILFTSGTTGQPKGVVHTHGSLRARWRDLGAALGVEPFRRTLCLLPTHFGHGLICNCLYPWLSGCELYLLPPFQPEFVMRLGEILDEHGITFMSSVPPVWHLALKTSRAPRRGSLERVFCGSAPLSARLWSRIQDWTGTRKVVNAYGITETGSWVAGTTCPDFAPEDGLIGVGWGAAVRILRSGTTATAPALAEECPAGQTGYVWLQTAALMKGYLERDDLTAAVVRDGWFLTGDIGVLDDRGYLYLRGREREEINRGGMKVYPGDIDAVVERFDAALDASAFPVDDPVYGQDIGLAVVLRTTEPDSVRALYDLMTRHLAEHQMPRRWYFLDAIPRTSRGKINRVKVAEACARLTPVDLHGILRGR